jgi:ATP-dependent DNA helicase RecG
MNDKLIKIPYKYVKYSTKLPIEENVIYNYSFLPETMKNIEEKVLIVGKVFLNNQSFRKTIIHSKRMKYFFNSLIRTGKAIDLTGTLFEDVLFFPKLNDKPRNELIELINTAPIELQNPLRMIHFPKRIDDAIDGFKQMYLYEISSIKQMEMNKVYRKPYDKLITKDDSNLKNTHEGKLNNIGKNEIYLFFHLTEEQQNVTKEIFSLLETNERMIGLIYGDVGSGKTILAFLAALKVFLNGKTVLVMAPTVILAHQLFDKFKEYGSFYDNINIQFETQVENSIIIGTHSLLFRDFENVGLVIIDEQHKFGVLQRQKLSKDFDVLMLSATPIPRTMYLLQLGKIHEFSISKRNESVVPHVIHNSNREKLINKLKNISQNEKILWVCKTIKKAEEVLKELSSIFQEVYLLHGNIKNKHEILKKFSDDNFLSNIKILISTTVIEVGIDLNVQMIVIENADQFGLSQIHQLKGRVGRREAKAFCFLIGENLEKLNLIKENYTGKLISELDLKIRGTGKVHQTNQSGSNFIFNKTVNKFKVEDFIIEFEHFPLVSNEIICFFNKSKNFI